MKKEKATIEDFARMCNKMCPKCDECPLTLKNNGKRVSCIDLLMEYTDKANEIILKWCIEKGRYISDCHSCLREHGFSGCSECRRRYWSEKVEE